VEITEVTLPYGAGGGMIKNSDRNRVEAFEIWCCREMLQRTNYAEITQPCTA